MTKETKERIEHNVKAMWTMDLLKENKNYISGLIKNCELKEEQHTNLSLEELRYYLKLINRNIRYFKNLGITSCRENMFMSYENDRL